MSEKLNAEAQGQIVPYTEVTDLDVDNITNKRELDQRSADGITVTAYWYEREDEVAIEVYDTRTHSSGEFLPPRDKVNDRFLHALAYVTLQPADGEFLL